MRLTPPILVIIGFFFIFFGFNAAQQYVVPLLALNGNERLALFGLLLLYVIFAISSTLSPFIIRKMGVKRGLVLGGITYVLFSSSIVLGSPFYFLMGSFLAGWGAGILWPASTRILSQFSSKESFGKNLSLQFAAVLGGSFAGVGVGSLNLSLERMNFFFLLCAVLSFLGVITFLFLPSMSKTTENIKIKISFFASPKILSIFPFVFSGYYLAASGFSVINLIVLDRFGLEKVGLFSNVFYIGSSLGVLLIARLTRNENIRRLVLLLALSVLFALILFSLPTNVSLKLFSVLIMGIFTAGVYPIGVLLLKRKVSEEEFGQGIGAFNVYLAFSIAFALIMAEYVKGWVGLLPAMISISVVVISSLVTKKSQSS